MISVIGRSKVKTTVSIVDTTFEQKYIYKGRYKLLKKASLLELIENEACNISVPFVDHYPCCNEQPERRNG
jgi:hypothetical protein